jgi:hypothetical protein
MMTDPREFGLAWLGLFKGLMLAPVTRSPSMRLSVSARAKPKRPEMPDCRRMQRVLDMLEIANHRRRSLTPSLWRCSRAETLKH